MSLTDLNGFGGLDDLDEWGSGDLGIWGFGGSGDLGDWGFENSDDLKMDERMQRFEDHK